MKQYIDTEALMQQRRVAAEYFVDLTTELLHTLEHFCVKVNQLTQDGNQNPAVIVALATAAALETDTTARFATTMVNILKGSLLPLSNSKIEPQLDSKITETRVLVRSLIEAYSNIPEKKIKEVAAAHADATLQESTTWTLVNAVKTFTAFNASLTNLQSALKDCTYALVSQDDKTINSLFQTARARFNEEHQEDLNAFLHDVTSATEAVKDLKSDYRSNTAVIHFIKNPDQPVRVIKRLRDEHFTEATLLDIFEYKMKYDALQAIIKNQKKSEKHSQSAPTINYQIGVLNNNGTITANSYEQLTAPTTVKQIENE